MNEDNIISVKQNTEYQNDYDQMEDTNESLSENIILVANPAENQVKEKRTDKVIHHIKANLGRYSTGKVYTKAEKKAFKKENADNARRLAQLGDLHSEKDRKDFLNKSDELFEKAAKKTKEMNAARKNRNTALERKLKAEILSLQSEARKCQIKAQSRDKEEEEFQLQLEEYWLLNRMEDLASENTKESYNQQHSMVESKKYELHKKMRGNKSFVAYRKRVLTKLKSEHPEATVKELEQYTRDKLGDDDSSVFTTEDYLTVFQQENDETRAIDNIMNKLRRYKDTLGGSPNFPNSDPTLPEELVMDGEHGVENRRAFARKMLRGNIFQKIYGKILETKYGQTIPATQYEIAFQYLESLKRLAMYKDIIKGEYEKDKIKQIEEMKKLPDNGNGTNLQKIYGKYTAGHDMLFALTRMSCHNNLNGAGIESDHCDTILKSIVVLVDKLEKSGNPDALLNYFRQLDGSCFDDRLRNVEEYAAKNDIVLFDQVVVSSYKINASKTDDMPDPGDNTLYIKKTSEVNAMKLNGEMDLVTAISKVIETLLLSNGMDPEKETPEWAAVRPELLRQLSGKSFFKNTEDGRKGTDSVEIKDSDIDDMESIMRDIMGVVA